MAMPPIANRLRRPFEPSLLALPRPGIGVVASEIAAACELPLTAMAVPLLTHSLAVPKAKGVWGAAEFAGTIVLALSAPYIAINEGFANWQSLWLCAAFVALAISLARVRGGWGQVGSGSDGARVEPLARLPFFS